MPNDNTATKAAPTRAATADEASAAGTPAAPVTDPAATAIAEAARKAETEQLTKQRDELRKLVGDADNLDALRSEVNALEQIAVRRGLTRSTQRMSAGVASDLELHGYAVDPANGDAYVREGDRVKVTSRSGATRTVDMPASASAAAAADASSKAK